MSSFLSQVSVVTSHIYILCIYTVCMCMRNSVCLELCVLHIVQHMDVYVMSDMHMCVFTSTSSACRIYIVSYMFTHTYSIHYRSVL